MSTCCDNAEDIKYYEKNKIRRFYYTPKGIVGIHKNDYYKIGGYDCDYLKDRSDSIFYKRMIDSDIKVLVEKVDYVYHIAHIGTHMVNPGSYKDNKI